MVGSSGSLKSANGSIHANGSLSRRAAGRRRIAKPGRGFVTWALSLVARLAIYAAIFTVLFRCPSSLDACDEISPLICRPYFQAKNAVSPHLQPYYGQYAAPYIHVAKPYYNAVNSRVLTPTRVYAAHYGAPWVKKGQEYVWSQWETNGQPRLAHLQALAHAHYDRTMAPHLTKVSKSVGPYYEIARTNSLQLFYEYLLPSYQFVRPYTVRGYDAVSDFTTNTALPATYWAWNKANVFFDTAVWPQLRAAYVENVEPQLVRIGERLGRYKNKAKTKVLPERSSSDGVSESAPSLFSKPTPQSSTQLSTSHGDSTEYNVAEAPQSQETTAEDSGPVKAPDISEDENETRRRGREIVTRDLEMWQNKFAARADEGATDIEERVGEIAWLMIDENVEVKGKDLVEQLEKTIESELAHLRRKISSIAEEGSDDAQDKAVGAVRSAGAVIKEKAQMIRSWHEDFDAELQQSVTDAADVHFQILDETRGLALQQIGMRWAWADGITYQDWAKYHELKNKLAQWTDELKQLVVTHPTLLKAQEASAQVEDEGLTIASAAARELARLNQVAQWKILAGDSTDDFDSEAMRLAAEAAPNAGQVEAPVADRLNQAQQVVENTATQLSSSHENETALSVTGAAAETLSSAVDAANVAPDAVEDQIRVAGRAAQEIFPGSVQAADEAGEEQSSVAKDAPRSSMDQAETSIPEKLDAADVPAADAAGASQRADTPNAEDDKSNDTEEDMEAPQEKHQEAEAPPVKAAVFGAAAQSVSDHGPIFDNVGDSDVVAKAATAAQAAYSSAVAVASDRYSSALSVVSAQIYGTPKPVHEQLISSVSAAYESAVAAASRKLHKAADAASAGVYGKPTSTSSSEPPGWERVESMAAKRLEEGRLWAEIQYHSALIALGMETPTPSPTSPTEKLVNQAKFNYYAGLGIAQDRYTSFLSSASSAWSSMTATPSPTDVVGSASSMASVAGESLASAARAAGESAHSVYSAATDSCGVTGSLLS